MFLTFSGVNIIITLNKKNKCLCTKKERTESSLSLKSMKIKKTQM